MELERLKDEGERLRKAREDRMEAAAKELRDEQKRRQAEQARKDDELGPLDTTIRLKWPRKQFPALEVDEEGVKSLLSRAGVSSSSIDSIVISSKMAANPKLKNGTAMVALKTLSAAVKIVESSMTGPLAAIETSWASGQEPEVVRLARERGQTGTDGSTTSAKPREDHASAQPPPPSPPRLSAMDEDSILEQFRARERERERLEEEIRRQDAEEAGE